MPQQQQSNVYALPNAQSDHRPYKHEYYLIFDPTSTMPPQITDSYDCAMRWQNKGCSVEVYFRQSAVPMH